jgi:hypothetical protein
MDPRAAAATGSDAVDSFGAVNGLSTASGTSDPVEMLSPDTALVAKNLSATFTSAPTTEGEHDLTLLVNGSLTLLDCDDKLSDTATTCSSPGPVPIPAGSTIYFEMAQQPFGGNTVPATDVLFSFEMDPA